MQVLEVETEHFRLLETQRVAFDPGINVITGANAQGKTTLLEAVWLLTGGRSFRTWYDRELIAFGQEEARVEGRFHAAGRDQKTELRLYRGKTRQMWRNGVKKRPSEAADALKVILFSPDDLAMVRGSAAGRRKLMDAAISQLRPGYAAALSDYNKVYENKLRILKSPPFWSRWTIFPRACAGIPPDSSAIGPPLPEGWRRPLPPSSGSFPPAGRSWKSAIPPFPRWKILFLRRRRSSRPSGSASGSCARRSWTAAAVWWAPTRTI